MPPADELRVVALPGVTPPLALVRPGEDFEVVAVHGGLRETVALAGAVAAVARRAGARRVVWALDDDRPARWLGFRARVTAWPPSSP
jgi:hypothetical protein